MQFSALKQLLRLTKSAEEEITAAEEEIAAEEEETTDKEEPTAEEEAISDTPAESNRAHLTSGVPRVARPPRGALTKSEIRELREIFTTLDDAEIARLYKRVTK